MDPNFIPLDAISNQPFDLDSIQIAKPCRADWNQMSGDARARHCGSCAKNVYNLSALTRAEAARLIQEKEGHLCVRFHRRADGTVLTSDCSVGISALKKGDRSVKTWIAASMAAILGVFGISASAATQGAPRIPSKTIAPLMGEIAPQALMGRIRITPSTRPRPSSNHAKHHAKPARKNRAKPDRRHR